jgi:hypothetical protein
VGRSPWLLTAHGGCFDATSQPGAGASTDSDGDSGSYGDGSEDFEAEDDVGDDVDDDVEDELSGFEGDDFGLEDEG